MRSFFESDTGFYYGVGAFIIAVFVLALAALFAVSPSALGARELGGLVVGFCLFMGVYFVSVTVHRLEEFEEL